MTSKLEELEAAYDAAEAAYLDAVDAYCAADIAYKAELKKSQKEQTND